MDEIDNIILHSLRNIGCTFDDTDTDTDDVDDANTASTSGHSVQTLADLRPAALLPCVVRCLRLIQPEHATSRALPASMPAGMAQRFAATTALAEACTAAGYAGDIGYQTFLYSNVVEVRRVLMHLIERLPLETSAATVATSPGAASSKRAALEAAIGRHIRLQLDAAWTPQYCKRNGIVRLGGSDAGDGTDRRVQLPQCSALPFRPHRVHIAHPTRGGDGRAAPPTPALLDYWTRRSPTLFQQTHGVHLCATLLHRNAVDRLREERSSATKKLATSAGDLEQRFERLLRVYRATATAQTSTTNAAAAAASVATVSSVQQLTLDNLRIPHADDIVSMPEISERDSLAFDIEKLRQSIVEADAVRGRRTAADLRLVRDERAAAEMERKELAAQHRVLERTQILLEDPAVNVQKMGAVLAATERRMDALREQWQLHRAELVARLERAQLEAENSPSRQLLEQLQQTSERSTDVAAQVAAKIAQQAKLQASLRRTAQHAANRDDYTTHILEIIANIRKQKADIAKVLLDTRVLQKELNNVSGQLDRQYTVTDDLLFKNAKRDEHAKAAYKHLATLHADCGDLVRMVEETGAVVREVRELEDQIETEKSRNVAANLQRITRDLQLVIQEGRELAGRVQRLEETDAGATKSSD